MNIEKAKKELDAIAFAYEATESEIETLEADLKDARERLAKLTAEHGERPARSDKSLTLATSIFRVRLIKRTQTSIDANVVEKIRATTKPEVFERIFNPVIKYTLVPGGNEVFSRPGRIVGAPGNIRELYTQAIITTQLADQVRLDHLTKKDSK